MKSKPVLLEFDINTRDLIVLSNDLTIELYFNDIEKQKIYYQLHVKNNPPIKSHKSTYNYIIDITHYLLSFLSSFISVHIILYILLHTVLTDQ